MPEVQFILTTLVSNCTMARPSAFLLMVRPDGRGIGLGLPSDLPAVIPQILAGVAPAWPSASRPPAAVLSGSSTGSQTFNAPHSTM